jgi:hypothetical protein
MPEHAESISERHIDGVERLKRRNDTGTHSPLCNMQSQQFSSESAAVMSVR